MHDVCIKLTKRNYTNEQIPTSWLDSSGVRNCETMQTKLLGCFWVTIILDRYCQFIHKIAESKLASVHIVSKSKTVISKIQVNISRIIHFLQIVILILFCNEKIWSIFFSSIVLLLCSVSWVYKNEAGKKWKTDQRKWVGYQNKLIERQVCSEIKLKCLTVWIYAFSLAYFCSPNICLYKLLWRTWRALCEIMSECSRHW